jgi:hypothetical protein
VLGLSRREGTMYCSVCGQQLLANQPSCPKCGRAVAAPIPPVFQQGAIKAVPLFQSRVERHAHTLGILWIAYAIWQLLSWTIAATILSGMFGGMAAHAWGPFGRMGSFGDAFPFGHIPWLIPFISMMLVARSILSLITGVGLMRREPWGRTLALVTAFLTLIKPITGTALSIYTLWVLLPSDSALEYEELSQ